MKNEEVIHDLTNYFFGYYEAIQELLPKIKVNKKIIFPLTLLISQYLELWVKTIDLCYSGQESGFDIKSLKLNTHNVENLICNEEIKEEFISIGIKKEELDRIIGLYNYYFGFVEKGSSLSEMTRFPIRIKDNKKTMKYSSEEIFKKININEYIENTNEISKFCMKTFIAFLDNERALAIKRIKVAENYLSL